MQTWNWAQSKLTLNLKQPRYEWKPPYKGSVWIGFILLKLKTYCWNHCSKIIFKCVNSAVRPIFYEKIHKKKNLWVREQCTDVLFTEIWSKVAATVYIPYMNSNRKWGENAWKKKKKGKRRTETQQTNPNTHKLYPIKLLVQLLDT